MRPSIVTRSFFSFFSLSSSFPCTFTFYFLEPLPTLPAPSRTIVHDERVLAYATFTRMPFERVRGSWNSMGTCAYGDGRVTCLPSGPCKHETTLGVETPRETIAIFAYFTRLTLYIYIYIYNVCCTPFATLPSNTHFEGNQHSCTTLQTVRNETKRVKRIRFINLSVRKRFH